MVSLKQTHGDIGQLVSGAVRVDAVEVRTVTVHSTQDQSSSNVALIPEQTKQHIHRYKAFFFILRLIFGY